uniref:uncharacterized protein LOC120339754 n=1 Tax=Styela clava TaxID=7725 RepID=UPI0019397F05|nr:uncharacterized protein LOC120339754 [Styela clava]
MVKFAFAIIVCWATLLHRTYASCPSITGENRQYNAGEKVRMQCGERPGVYYEAECVSNGFWIYPTRDAICKHSTPVAAPAYQPPNAVVVVTKPKKCKFIPGYMRDIDAGRMWKNGDRYWMRCEDKIRLFAATCSNKAWLFEENVCQGPAPTGGILSNLFGPMQVGPRPALPSTHPSPDDYSSDKHTEKPIGQGLFDGFYNALDGLWGPKEGDGQASGGLNLQGLLDPVYAIINPKPDGPKKYIDTHEHCPYNEFMDIEYRQKVFSHGYKYRAHCSKEEYHDRYFVLICENGVWKYDEKDCESINSYFTLAFNECKIYKKLLFINIRRKHIFDQPPHYPST